MKDLPWDKYRANRDPVSFSEVYHICHISDAIRIVEDGRIVSSLIWDESCLNNTRALVSWVSPNRWAYGSIYGHISFVFDWEDLIDGKDFYWVEAMTTYNPDAFRVLIADPDDISAELKDLIVPFDPSIEGGPIHTKEGTWYRNNGYTAEFMIDADVRLSTLSEIEFVEHNRICKRDGRYCSDRELDGRKAGSLFFASIIGRNRTTIGEYLIEEESGQYGFCYYIRDSLVRLYLSLLPDEYRNEKYLSADESLSVMQAAFVVYGGGMERTATGITTLFSSVEEFSAAFFEMIGAYFLSTNRNIEKGIEDLKGQIRVYS